MSTISHNSSSVPSFAAAGGGSGSGPAKPYIVQPGDSLWVIAESLHLPLGDLLDANPSIKNANLIYPGQSIIAPATHHSVKSAHQMATGHAGNTAHHVDFKAHASGHHQVSHVKEHQKSAAAPVHARTPLWMQIAEDELRIWQHGGGRERHRKYLKETGGPDDNWCSIFVNWVMQRCGYSGTRNWLALSWIRWGVPIHHPRAGAIAIVKDHHPDNPYPHVAFVRSHQGSSIVNLLGGNQGGGAGAVTDSRRFVGERSSQGSISFEYRWPPH